MAKKDKSLFDSEIVESGRRRARGTEAVGVETIASLVAESQGASPEEPGKAATSMKADDGDGDEEAGAAAAAMDAWRSAARDARAVVTLGKGGDAAGLPETEAAAWKKVFA